MTTTDTLKGAKGIRPLFAMLATSLAFASPVLAMDKNAHSAAVQAGAPTFGAVTFTAEGESGLEMTSILTVGGDEFAPRRSFRRTINKVATGYYDVTGYAMRFRVLGELDRTAVLQVFAEACEKKRVTDQEIQKMKTSNLDDTITPAENCRSVEQTLSIPDGDTVPLIVKATGERLGTLTWNTVPSAFTTGSPRYDH